jgi:enoyl-CoA hydratase
MAQNETVLLECKEGVAEITLNRPERRNALTDPMRVALLEAVQAASADESVQVVLLRGAGGAFCSGIDLKALNEQTSAPDQPVGRQAWIDVQVALFDCDKIVVGALERFAINAGGPLALACDHLIVGDTAFLQVGEIQQGVSPAMNLAWLMLKHGEARAARFALHGDRVGAQALLRLGVASEVVADDRVVERARELAGQLAGYPADGARAIKRSLRAMGPAAGDGRAWFERAMALNPNMPRAGIRAVS